MSAAVTIIFTVVYLAVTVFLCRGLRLNTDRICLGGVFIALTLVLEAIVIPLPTGSSIPLCSMVPLMLLALLVDYRLAFVGGWLTAILAMVLIPGWQPVHWGQFFVEHAVCFSCLGYAGIFGSDKKWKVLCGICLASVLKFFGHLLSGVLFFSQNAWDGWGAWGYSFLYNLSGTLPLSILCGVIVLALPLSRMRLLRKTDSGTKEERK